MSSSKMLKGDVGGLESSNVAQKGHFKNKLRVLVVDDTKMQRRILTTQLGRLGVETKEAENGKEAVDLFAESSNFDLILMDNDMPIMDGPQATRILRSMGVRAKIVGLSSHTSSDAINKFMDAGLDVYFTKPMNHADLIALLHEVDQCKSPCIGKF